MLFEMQCVPEPQKSVAKTFLKFHFVFAGYLINLTIAY